MKGDFRPGLYSVITAVCMAVIAPVTAQEELYGDIGCHDPSTLVKDGNRYYFFRTGAGVPYHYSTDLRNWTFGGTVFSPVTVPPAWVSTAVQDYDPNNWCWAPDVAYFNGKYHVYYSVSEWGTIDSVIGLVTSPSLITPTWTDQGKVVQSDAAGETVPETDTTAYNCIDPSILVDTNGTVWMTFGSYSSGILVTELDPSTGLRMNTNALVATQVANNSGYRGWGSSIEGAFTYQHGGYYYLFVNYGGCCSGVDSTYNIRVGRSTSVTGPYYDKDGVDMRDGGGTMLLESSGRFVGPGHAAILNDNGTEWFSYHYYTWPEYGSWSQLGLARLGWDENEWPELSFDWSAFYPFSTDAHEQMDFYDGTLNGGASIVSDSELGNVLELDGTGYVELSNAVANCSSIATWVKWDGGIDDTWQRIFDFGTDTTNYMFLTPKAYLAGMRFAITTDGPGGEQPIDAPFVLPTNTWCHVAVTLDGEQGIMYFNGEPVATNTVTIRPWEIQARANYIGKSQWPDPGFEGRIASFRVFAHALTPQEVKEIAYAPPSLAHRYSFTEDVGDSIGKANGKLKGAASITNGSVSLPGAAGSYAQLPGGIVTGCGAVSIEFWADIGANVSGARAFAFGNLSGTSPANFLRFVPGLSGDTKYLLEMPSRYMLLDGTLNNQKVHVVCIIDPASSYGAVYVNGELVQSQTVLWPALSVVGKNLSYLGRALSDSGYFSGDIDEFRIYDGRLTAQQIAGNYAAGPDKLYQPIVLAMTNDAGTLNFEWPSYPAGFGLEYSTALKTNAVWAPMTAPLPENGTYGLSVPSDSVSTSNAFFRLQR